MTFEELKKGIMIYINREFCNKLAAGDWRRWAIPMVSQMAAPALDRKYDELLPTLKTMNIVEESGCIDLDLLYNSLKKASTEQGSIVYPIPLLGEVTFSSVDVDSMYQILKGIASPTPPVSPLYTPIN